MYSKTIGNILNELEELSRQVLAEGYPKPRLLKFSAETPESIAAVEHKIGANVPPDLAELLMARGGFFSEMDVDGFALCFNNRPSYPSPMGPLADVLDAARGWDAYREPDDFPEESIAIMNREFFCFGHCECGENAWDHFFFDRKGYFGVIQFDQDYWPESMCNHLLELGTGTNRHRMSLEEVLLPGLVKAKHFAIDFLEGYRKSL